MYKVDNIVNKMMYNPCSISYDQWCKQVKETVYQKERDVSIVTKGMYKKTVIFNYCITNIEMWCWWKVSSVDTFPNLTSKKKGLSLFSTVWNEM